MNPPRIFSSSVFSVFVLTVLLPVLYIFFVPIWEGQLSNVFDSRHISLAVNSIRLAAGTTFASLIIGLSVSMLLAKTDIRGSKVLLPLFILPILIPPHIHAIVWNQVSSSVNKIIPFDIHNLGGAVFVLTLAYYPFIVLLTISGLNSIDKSTEESSLLIHGKWKTLYRITSPLVFPHIFSGAVFVFIFSIIDFGVPDILRVNVWPIEIFIQFSAFYNEKAAIILSLPMAAITGMLVILQKFCMKNRTYIQVSGGIAKNIRYPLGKWHIPLFLFCVILILFSSIIPIFILGINAGHPSNYFRALSSSASQIGFTFLISIISSFFIVLTGFSISYIIERSKGILAHVMESGTFILLAVPAITMGISLIKIWNRPTADIIYSSFLIIILGHTARFLPFAVLPLCSSIKQLNPGMEEAASIAGSRWLKIMYRIVLPLSAPALLVSFFVVFILSFGEMGATLLLIPPGMETISIKIYNLMHYGAHELVNALSLILIALIFGLFGLFLYIFNKIDKSDDTSY
ncbi:ABC transporter transmembrane domain-containing protein, MetI-like [Desulfonema limicola]|uniref:ABC transporter transmembrane domain-containing protein, MetI-like n=1 Tax=Desulfonema limicola TaxID=45656 RepID=A0A975GFP7_9BACT|nr:iron ABC transporter permease [Desulfonema limicola]QTA79394.1 ABC transporter transmembrane domain-containing protein, MetI-like [Desulfonema limicola]